MTYLGMDVDGVRNVGHQLKAKAAEAGNVVKAVDSLVHGMVWTGHDADMFKTQWWPDLKVELAHIAHDLDGLGQSALNNAQAQENISRR